MPQIPCEGCSPHLNTWSEHQKSPIYGALRQITPPKKLHEKGQFPTLYSQRYPKRGDGYGCAYHTGEKAAKLTIKALKEGK